MKHDKTEKMEKTVNGQDVSRRSFMKIAGAGLIATTTMVGCDGRPSGGNGWVPEQYEGMGHLPPQVRGRVPIDPHNLAISRNDQKCILCGQCSEVCSRIEAVLDNYELPLIDDIPCIGCGQCTLWCPTGAITEADDIDAFFKALEDPEVHVVVQTAPSTRVALAEEFGMPPGTNVEGRQVAALKKLGANTVLDTNFSADLTIMEEATELVKRIKGELEGPVPQFTSCCPGWVKYCEYFYPELIPNLSSAKSPMGMLGAMIKTYYAEKQQIKPKKIFSVAVMPCTAKKFEAGRPEMNHSGLKNGDSEMRDTDLVITTRELAKMIKMKGIDLMKLDPIPYDKLMSEYSGAGAIFGVTGGVMEAAVRTAYYLLTEENPPKELYKLEPIRGLAGIKEAKLEIPGVGEIWIAVVTGMENANKILDTVKKGSKKYHFIEFMACPGGCNSGGGQPKTSLPPSDQVRQARMSALYTIDEKATLRLCHENEEIKALYKDYLGEPNGHLAHELLHTAYEDRSMHLTAKKKA